MPWPGAPKSQQTPALNPPSVRYPSRLTENSSPGEVAAAVNKAFEGLTVHEQAFANIPAQVANAAATAASDAMSSASETVINNTGTTGVTAFNGATGPITYFPSLGFVNDQLGNPSYITEQQDNGAKIIVGDSSAFTLTLSQEVVAPWFTIIDNDSSAMVTLSSDSGASVFGERTIPGGGFGIVFFDGADFWCGSTGSGISLTTSGSSGPATLSGDVLNIPVYVPTGGGVTRGATITNADGSYWVWSDGIKEAWGRISCPATGTFYNGCTITFPNSGGDAFTAVPELSPSIIGLPSTTGDPTTPAAVGVNAISTSGATVYMARVIVAGAGGGNFDQTVTLNWRAIGP